MNYSKPLCPSSGTPTTSSDKKYDPLCVRPIFEMTVVLL